MSEKIVQLNEEVIKGQIKELVRGSVEETLNELLEKEAESLTQAARYERSEARQGYRSGHYDRNLTTTSGDVTLHMPRLKGVSFETAIIERYRRRESSVEEALIEMYLAGVSVRRRILQESIEGDDAPGLHVLEGLHRILIFIEGAAADAGLAGGLAHGVGLAYLKHPPGLRHPQEYLRQGVRRYDVKLFICHDLTLLLPVRGRAGFLSSASYHVFGENTTVFIRKRGRFCGTQS